jgi:hypothetical protein
MSEKRTFAALAKGEIDYLDLAVCIAATWAERVAPWNGVWRLDRATFLVIAANIQKASGFTSLEKVIAACDDPGPGQRFFRLNEAFAAWLDRTEPQSALDAIVM